MRTTKRSKVAALAVGLALVAAACSDDKDDTKTSTAPSSSTAAPASSSAPTDSTATSGSTTESSAGSAAEGSSFTWAYEQEFSAYNSGLSNTNASKNAVVLNKVLPDTFYFSADGSLQMDKELLDSAEVTSESPQTVVYKLNAKAAWSDGEAIDCDDFKVNYVANSGKHKKMENGVVATDGETKSELLLFDTAGTTGYDQIKTVDCKDGDKTITVTFDKPFGDWKSLFTGLMPAHVVEKQAGVADIIKAVDEDNVEDLTKAAKFWNEGWILNPGQLKPEIMPSGDAFIIDKWEAGASITLKANPKYWGTPAKSDTVVIRYIEQQGQAQALENKEVQAMDPQPNPDLVAQLSAMAGVKVENAELFTFEHYDFNFKNANFAKKEVREAFAMCLPRQQIIDSLIKPQNPEAKVLNSRYFQSFEKDYTDTSGGKYDKVDAEGAKAKLAAAGVTTPIDVRVGYKTPNQRRTNEVELLKASCDPVGFNIIDSGKEDFFDVDLPEGNFDVALFAWAGSSLKSGSSSTYITGGGNNQGNYSNPEVDKLINELNQTIDEAKITELAIKIDTMLWDDLATIPAFTFPGILAYDENAKGVQFNPTQADLSWNAQEWQAAE